MERPWPDERVHWLGLDARGELEVVTRSGRWRTIDGTLARDTTWEAVDTVGAALGRVPDSGEIWQAGPRRTWRRRDGAWQSFPTSTRIPYLLVFAGPDDGWLGGQGNQLERWDGQTWTPVDDPALPKVATHAIGTILVRAPDDVWIFARGSAPVRFDGREFTATPPFPDGWEPGFGDAAGACALPDGQLLFVDYRVHTWDGAAWSRVEDVPDGIYACATDPAGRTWLAGAEGRIGVLEEGVFRSTSNPIPGKVDALVFDARGRGFALSGSRLLHTAVAGELRFEAVPSPGTVADPGEALQVELLSLDGDLQPDLMLVNHPGELRLLRNRGGFEFADANDLAGIGGLDWAPVVTHPCDIDGDGDSDLLTVGSPGGGLVYFRNRGGTFTPTDVEPPPDLRPGIGKDIDCADLDRDGDLDVLVTRLYSGDSWPVANLVYENLGYGRLRGAVPAARGLGGERDWTFVSAAVDLLGDPGPEVFASVLWTRSHRLWRRLDDGRWADVSEEVGLGTSTPWGNLPLPGDLDGDGDFDLLVLESRGRSHLYRNDGSRLEDVAAFGFVGPTGRGRDDHTRINGDLVDLDGDADLDLVVADWQVGARIHLNDGGLVFREVTAASGTRLDDVRATAAADLDLDGDIDLYLGRAGEPNVLLRNPAPGGGRHVRLVSLRRAPGGATVRLLDPHGELRALRSYPTSGVPLALPPAGGSETLQITFADGTVVSVPAPAAGASTVHLEAGPTRFWLGVSWAVGHRLAWMDRQAEGLRAGAFLLLLACCVAVGRTRRARWFGGVPVPLALAGLYSASALALVEATAPTRLAALPAAGAIVVGLAWLDLRLTRLRRATRIAHFRLQRSLGEGGMGRVHLAHDTSRGRRVALKVMHYKLSSEPTAVARFRREAELGARFDHPGLVKVFEAGECTVFDGDQPRRTLYMAMEFVDGRSLREWLSDTGPLPLGQACRIGVELLRALAVLHDGGVIHRDLKPDNVMVRADGAIKLTDYGIARGKETVTLTGTGQLMGTIAYMPPEQAQGSRPDRRADLWSAGVLIYELLSGRRPFAADDPMVLVYKILTDEPPRLDGLRAALPVPVVEAVHRALERTVEDRWHDAAGFAEALEPYADRDVSTRSLRSGGVDVSAGGSLPPGVGPGVDTGAETTFGGVTGTEYGDDD